MTTATGLGSVGWENVSSGFPETQWTMVLDAGGPTTPERRRALEDLCQSYWYPIYCYIRRKAGNFGDPLDLTQRYFVRLLEQNKLTAVVRGKGRFRSFLTKDCSFFVKDAIRREHARSVRPHKPILSLDARDAEGNYLHEPADVLTPEQVFFRESARNLMRLVLNRLEEAYALKRNSLRFGRLKAFLTEDEEAMPYAEIARRLEISEGGVATAVHRLRKDFGRLLREEIARTVSDPADIDDEIRDLFELLSARGETGSRDSGTGE